MGKSVLMETKGAGEANGDVDVIVADVPQTTVGTEAAESALSRDELRRQLRSKLAKGSLCRTKGVFKGLGDPWAADTKTETRVILPRKRRAFSFRLHRLDEGARSEGRHASHSFALRGILVDEMPH